MTPDRLASMVEELDLTDWLTGEAEASFMGRNRSDVSRRRREPDHPVNTHGTVMRRYGKGGKVIETRLAPRHLVKAWWPPRQYGITRLDQWRAVKAIAAGTPTHEALGMPAPAADRPYVDGEDPRTWMGRRLAELGFLTKWDGDLTEKAWQVLAEVGAVPGQPKRSTAWPDDPTPAPAVTAAPDGWTRPQWRALQAAAAGEPVSMVMRTLLQERGALDPDGQLTPNGRALRGETIRD